MEIYCLIFSLISVTMGFHIGDTVEVEVKHEAKTMATSIGLDQYPVKLVWGHGLGSKDPSTKNRFSDRTSNITFSAMDDAKARCICYDARGHGESHGWEETANNMFQFSWPYLAGDMIAVSNGFYLEKPVLGGSSMGSASALYAALQNKGLVSGLILVRPPTAWKERLDRKPQLIQAARELYESNPDGLYHNVLLGSAFSDLPHLSTLNQVLDIPVLILTAEGDPTHPVSTARALVNISSDVQLFISESYEAGVVEWPQLIAEFLQRF